MGTPSFRDSVLVIGASGRTGSYVLRYLCSAAVPTIACVRRPERLPSDSRVRLAEVAVANLEQPHTLAPLIDRAAHVVYLAGSDRKSLAAGAYQLEVDSLAACVEIAQRGGFQGRFIYVGYSGHEQRKAGSWAETRWREMKLAAEDVIAASDLNYFVLRTGRVTAQVSGEPRVGVSQVSAAPEAELPCNALAFMLTGVAMAGAARRSCATVRIDSGGSRLQQAVQGFGRLRSEGLAQRSLT